jgi:hypothetical protein
MHFTLHTYALLMATLNYSLCNCLLVYLVCVYLQGVGAADSSSTGAAGDDGLDAKTRMKEHGMHTLLTLLIAFQLQ